jgi:hypothetical protein
MNEEEKGFIIKDKRSFDEKGDLKEESREPEPRTQAETADQPQAEPEAEAQRAEQRPPLPEVNFTALIFSLSSSALLHFGEIADPVSGKKQRDLPLAKHAIDTIAMLKDKTQGNLNEDESKFIDTVLTDLRWRYVKANE